jgi:hypothetical protein
MFLVSYSQSGAFRYALGAGDSFDDVGRAVAVDSSGNAFVTGDFQGLVDFDSSAGSTTLTSISTDLFLASYDSLGQIRFAFGLGNTTGVVGSGIAIDSVGNVVIGGDFANTLDFDPGPGADELTRVRTGFVARYTNSGAYLDAMAFEPTSNSMAIVQDLALASDDTPYVTGVFDGTVDFDPGPGDDTLTNAGSNDIFHASVPEPGISIALGLGTLFLTRLKIGRRRGRRVARAT